MRERIELYESRYGSMGEVNSFLEFVLPESGMGR